MWSIRVYGGLLGQKVLGYIVRGDPNVVVPGQVDLVDGTIFFAPIGEFDEAVLLRNFRNRADDWIT